MAANNKKYLVGRTLTREDLLTMSINTKVYLRRVDGVRTLKGILKQPFWVVETWLRNEELFEAINKYSDEYELEDIQGTYVQFRDATPRAERRLRIATSDKFPSKPGESFTDGYQRDKPPGGQTESSGDNSGSVRSLDNRNTGRENKNADNVRQQGNRTSSNAAVITVRSYPGGGSANSRAGGEEE